MPLTEFYCPISENSHFEVEPAHGGVEIGEVVILPDPSNIEDWLSFERNRCGATVPDAQFGDSIHDPTLWTGS